MPIFICAAVLTYGGIVDFKRREIPNAVPIILLANGVFLNFFQLQSIMGLIVPALMLLAAAKITRSEVPGGDFKLLCSLGFACGLPGLAAIVFIAGIGALLYGIIKHLPIKRHIPLCSYIAPAYITFQVIALVIEGR